MDNTDKYQVVSAVSTSVADRELRDYAALLEDVAEREEAFAETVTKHFGARACACVKTMQELATEARLHVKKVKAVV